MMTDSNGNRPLKIDVAEHIRLASSVLRHSLLMIPKLFPDKEICTFDYHHNESDNKLVEIRLDTATLTCFLNKNSICDSSFLFLDNTNDLIHYIDYFNRTFVFDHSHQTWLMKKSYICVRKDEKEYFIALYPLENTNTSDIN